MEFRLNSHSYNGRYMYLTCTQEPVVGENKSILHWTLTVTGGSANNYTTGPTTVKIGEETVYYAPTAYYNTQKFPACKGSVSGTAQVLHDEDGSKTVSCSIQTAIYTGVQQLSKADWVLEPLPRESTLAATDCYVESTSMIAVDRKNPNYTHTIAFQFGQLQGYLLADGSISQQAVQITAVSLPFPIPAEFYSQFPNEKAVRCSLTCTTFDGQTQIGQPQQTDFLITAREESCKPLVSGTVADRNPATLALTGDENKLIRFFSTADCQIEALPRGQAVIAQRKIAGISVTENQLELPTVETGTFLFQATDSRGYKGEYTAEKELIPYEKLTAVASARRLSPTEDRAEITVSGVCFWGNFGAQENTLQVFCYVGSTPIELSVTPTETGYTAQGVVEGLSYLYAHSLLVMAQDKLMQAQFPVLVNAGTPVFDWGQGDFTFHVPVTLADGSQAISRQEVLELLATLGQTT